MGATEAVTKTASREDGGNGWAVVGLLAVAGGTSALAYYAYRKHVASKGNGLKDVQRVSKDITPEDFYEKFYVKQQPVVIEGLASSCPGTRNWTVGSVFKLVNDSVSDPADLECVTKVEKRAKPSRDASSTRMASPHYQDVSVESVQGFFAYVKRCISGKPVGPRQVSLKNGIAIPTKKILDHCPVPPLLRKLHEERKIRIRDLMGRKYGRIFISAGGLNERCHYNHFGYAFFSVQAKGSKTWLLYPADSLSLRRAEPFSDAPPEDFTKDSVLQRFTGLKAKLFEGDVLFIPAYTYHAVRHVGSFNVNVDFECMPDEMWNKRAQTYMGWQDIAGLCEGVPFMCYTLPGLLPSLIPRMAIKELRLWLFDRMYEDKNPEIRLGLVKKHLLDSEEDISPEEVLSKREECAACFGEDALLLEACLACESVFAKNFWHCLGGAFFLALALYEERRIRREALEHGGKTRNAHYGKFKGEDYTCVVVNRQGHVLALGPDGSVIEKNGRAIQRIPDISLSLDEFQSEGIYTGSFLADVKQLVYAIIVTFSKDNNMNGKSVSLPAIFILRENEKTHKLEPIMTQLKSDDLTQVTESCTWGAFLNKGFAVWIVGKVQTRQALGPRRSLWSGQNGVLLQICAPNENLGFFFEEVDGLYQKAINLELGKEDALIADPALIAFYTGSKFTKPLKERRKEMKKQTENNHHVAPLENGGKKAPEELDSVTHCSEASSVPDDKSNTAETASTVSTASFEADTSVDHDAAEATQATSAEVVKQPPLPEVKCASPYSEAKLQGLVPSIKQLVGILAKHYTAPTPAGQPSIRWPTVFVLRQMPDDKFCMPMMSEVDAPLTKLTRLCKFALDDGKAGHAMWVVAEVLEGNLVGPASTPYVLHWFSPGVLDRLYRRRFG